MWCNKGSFAVCDVFIANSAQWPASLAQGKWQRFASSRGGHPAGGVHVSAVCIGRATCEYSRSNRHKNGAPAGMFCFQVLAKYLALVGLERRVGLSLSLRCPFDNANSGIQRAHAFWWVVLILAQPLCAMRGRGPFHHLLRELAVALRREICLTRHTTARSAEQGMCSAGIETPAAEPYMHH